jgi:hypothetical protein
LQKLEASSQVGFLADKLQLSSILASPEIFIKPLPGWVGPNPPTVRK